MLSSQARCSSCRAISAVTGAALRRGRGGRRCTGAEGADAISGNTEPRLSIATLTLRGGLGRSIRLVVLLGFASSLLFEAQKAVLRRSLRSGSRRARKGSREGLAAAAWLGFSTAVTPEHAARACEVYPGVIYLCRYPVDDRRGARQSRDRHCTIDATSSGASSLSLHGSNPRGELCPSNISVILFLSGRVSFRCRQRVGFPVAQHGACALRFKHPVDMRVSQASGASPLHSRSGPDNDPR
jgi:hypothetical protein